MTPRKVVIRTTVAAALVGVTTAAAVLENRGGATRAAAQATNADAPTGVTAGGSRAPVKHSFASSFAAEPSIWVAPGYLSPPLRDLPTVTGPIAPRPEAVEPPEESEAPVAPDVVDPAVQRFEGAGDMPTPLNTFVGLRNQDNLTVAGRSARPPDNEGDVGPNHYVEWINVLLAVYSKTGTMLLGPVLGNAVFQNLPATDLCRTTNQGDPLVNYDQLADRWVLSQFAFSIDATSGLPIPPFHQCVAVSTTPNPMGTYCTYSFLASATNFNDYGKMGVWPDGYYFSYAAFAGATAYVGPAVQVMERPKMIAPGCPAAQSIYFDPDTLPTLANQKRMLPSDLDGANPPPAGRPNFFLASSSTNNTLQLWKFSVASWLPPVATFLKNQTEIPVPAYDPGITCVSSRQCIPQLGTTNRLDTVPDRLMYELNYRNFGASPPPGIPANTESLVTNETVDAGSPADHAGVRWYEIRDPNGTPVAFQAATYAPDAHHRWMASAAQDKLGNIAVGYSVSSTAIYPAIRYAGRLVSDPLNQLAQGEAEMFAGTAPAPIFSTTTADARWGDYTRLSVDPVDDCTFWYINEYHIVPPQDADPRQWHTRIGNFRFCSPTAVAVNRFTARWTGKRVAVTWRTGSEAEVLGFNVFRSLGAGPFRKVNTTLIAARHDLGGAYRLIDRTVKRSKTYTYRLQVVSKNGARSWHGIGSAAAR